VAVGPVGKSSELSTTKKMARLWRSQGNVHQARELLAPVTKGLDVRDLKEAMASLVESAAYSDATRGEFELKGIRRPLAAYNVVGAQSSPEQMHRMASL
jgi:hypothetical protein